MHWTTRKAMAGGVIATIGFGGLAFGAAVAAASGPGGPPPTTLAYPTATATASAAARPAAPSAASAAIAAAVPGAAVTPGHQVRDGVRSYDEFSVSAKDGRSYSVTVYQRFDPTELDGAGLARRSVSGGTVWIGSDDASSASIYFLARSGVGLWISQDRSPTGAAASVTALESVASQLASATSIQQEAGR